MGAGTIILLSDMRLLCRRLNAYLYNIERIHYEGGYDGGTASCNTPFLQRKLFARHSDAPRVADLAYVVLQLVVLI